jgi:UDP-N-acetylglucosamine 2-epimerase (non-hydrolysing)
MNDASQQPLVHLIAGARPNFMKVAPLWHALKRETWCRTKLVHTGQHYDEAMSEVFLRELGLPKPDHALDVGSGSHAEQTAAVMVAYEKVAMAEKPAWIVVVGDVNSTMAVTIAAKKLWLNVAHLEAGLRSFDRTMPEEINRLLTDSIADVLWTPSPDGDANLLKEGIAPDKIERVGNIMIDTFEMMRDRIEAARTRSPGPGGGNGHGVITLHRPANVDNPARLGLLVDTLLGIAGKLPLVFPIHPRTRGRLVETGLYDKLAAHPSIRLSEPLGYTDFMALVTSAKLVVTDSGGVQEETTHLGIPCLTLRESTERPVTVTHGSNQLITTEALGSAMEAIFAGEFVRRPPPEFWDGRTAGRVVASLKRRMGA